MINDFSKALNQLRDPQIIRPLLYSAIAALVMLSAMLVLGIWLIKSAGIGGWTPSWTFLSFLNNAIQLLFDITPILIAIFLFPTAAVFLQAFVLDNVIEAVEARHYPGHKSSHHQRWHEIAIGSCRFAVLAIALNLCLLIISIFLLFAAPPLAPIPFYLVNGYLLGREYFSLVAVRHLTASNTNLLRKRNKRANLRDGVFLTFLFSMPIINLVAPILATSYMTHRFHRAWQN
jgi:CysZ protein